MSLCSGQRQSTQWLPLRLVRDGQRQAGARRRLRNPRSSFDSAHLEVARHDPPQLPAPFEPGRRFEHRLDVGGRRAVLDAGFVAGLGKRVDVEDGGEVDERARDRSDRDPPMDGGVRARLTSRTVRDDSGDPSFSEGDDLGRWWRTPDQAPVIRGGSSRQERPFTRGPDRRHVRRLSARVPDARRDRSPGTPRAAHRSRSRHADLSSLIPAAQQLLPSDDAPQALGDLGPVLSSTVLSCRSTGGSRQDSPRVRPLRPSGGGGPRGCARCPRCGRGRG